MRQGLGNEQGQTQGAELEAALHKLDKMTRLQVCRDGRVMCCCLHGCQSAAAYADPVRGRQMREPCGIFGASFAGALTLEVGLQAMTRKALDAALAPAALSAVASFSTKELRQQLETSESVRAATKRALDAVFADH